MTTLTSCEDEKIHLQNSIQDFGILLVFDHNLVLQHCSANSHEFTNTPSQELLNIHLDSILEDYFKDDKTKILQEIDFVKQHSINKTIQINKGEKSFFLTIYEYNKLLYFEIEELENYLSTSELPNTSFQLLDDCQFIWDNLCKIIQSIIKFDRVMIYQFREDQSGKVIAETKHPELESYLNYHYPEFDIPKQARKLYLKNMLRMVANIDAGSVPILSTSMRPLNLSYSQLRALSPTHLEYLRNAKVKASCSISLIMHGKLWGLVACQNRDPKHISLNARNQSIAMAKYACNLFIQRRDQELLKTTTILKKLELELQSKSLIKNSIKDVIIENLSFLKKLVKADGIAYAYENQIHTDGVTPNNEIISAINNALHNNHSGSIFSSSTFYSTFKNLQFDETSAGVMWITMHAKRKENLLWFRKEQIEEITWAGNPIKQYSNITESDTIKISPRNSFAAWKETVRGSAFPWSEKDLFIAENLKNQATETALIKLTEIKSLNDELKDLNYALDSYAYTISHDLKNPLSVLKLNTQMIIARPDLETEFIKKRASMILEGINKMNDLISGILEISRTKKLDIYLELRDPRQTIEKIFEDSKQNHDSDSCQLIIQDTLPIYIEKTMEYQIFSNIISNAVKYSSKSTHPQVLINCLQDTKYTTYFIEDNGVGIVTEEVDNIFKIFHRLSNVKDFKGSGVGLSIVKQIMKRLNGNISIHARPSGGTQVLLQFVNKPLTEHSIPSN